MNEKAYLVFLEPSRFPLPGGEPPEVPEWFRVLPLGKLTLINNKFPEINVLAADLPEIIKNVQARSHDLVIDYRHQTLDEKRDAPAAGWIKALEARDDGLWARAEWTPKGRERLLNREYRYFSPVLLLDLETLRPFDFRHLALTNTPSIAGLEPLIAQAQNPDRATAAAKENQEEEAMKNRLVQLLAMQADAPDTEVLTALEAKLTLAGALPEIGELLGLEAEKINPSTVKGAILALKQGAGQVAQLQTEVTALKAAQTEARAEAAVAEAIKARKITPALKDWALAQARADLEAFQVFVDKAPVMLPAAEPLKFPTKDGGGEVTLTAEEGVICASIGVTAEAFKAEQKRQAQQAG